MYIIREIFTARPGMAGKMAKLFKRGFAKMPRSRVMTDMVGPYNTVIMEMEVDSLADWEKEMEKYKRGEPDPNLDPEVAKEMANYTDWYQTGRREIYQITE